MGAHRLWMTVITVFVIALAGCNAGPFGGSGVVFDEHHTRIPTSDGRSASIEAHPSWDFVRFHPNLCFKLPSGESIDADALVDRCNTFEPPPEPRLRTVANKDSTGYHNEYWYTDQRTIICLNPTVVVITPTPHHEPTDQADINGAGSLAYIKLASGTLSLASGYACGPTLARADHATWFSPDLDIHARPLEPDATGNATINLPGASLALTASTDSWTVVHWGATAQTPALSPVAHSIIPSPPWRSAIEATDSLDLKGCRWDLIFEDPRLGSIVSVRALPPTPTHPAQIVVAGTRAIIRLREDLTIESFAQYSTFPPGAYVGPFTRLVDLDGDSSLELVSTSSPGSTPFIFIINADGSIRKFVKLDGNAGEIRWFIPVDLDANGTTELLVYPGSSVQSLLVFDHLGNELPSIEWVEGINMENCLTLRDLNGDGVPELVYPRLFPQSAAVRDVRGRELSHFSPPDESTLYVIDPIQINEGAAARGAIAQYYARSFVSGWFGREDDRTWIMTLFNNAGTLRAEFVKQTREPTVAFGDTRFQLAPDRPVCFFSRAFCSAPLQMTIWDRGGRRWYLPPAPTTPSSGVSGWGWKRTAAEVWHPPTRTGDVLLIPRGASLWALTDDRSPALNR